MRALPKGGVSVLTDQATGQVMRVGQTRDRLRREGEHRRDPSLGCYAFKTLYAVDSYAIRRGLEQLVHDRHDPPLDLQEPISPRSPRRKKYLAAARRYLQR